MEIKNGNPQTAESAKELSWRRYFHNLALSRLSLIKMHRESGHLPSLKNLTPEQKQKNIGVSGQEDWSGVIRHCLAEAGAADALAYLLQLSDENRKNLIDAALLHDYDKRKEIEAYRHSPPSKPRLEVWEDYKKDSEQFLINKGVNPEIIEIIKGVGDLDITTKTDASLLKKILFYIDNITDGTDLVSVRTKWNNLRQRYPEHTAEGAYNRWAEVTEQVQAELAAQIGLANPEDLPTFILQTVKQLSLAKNQPESGRDLDSAETTREIQERFSLDVKSMSEAALQAGRVAIESRGTFKESDVYVKRGDNVGNIQAFTTPADIACEKAIYDQLSGINPRAKFLMEEKIIESSGEGAKRILDAENFLEILSGTGYIVDPLDGTREYKNLRPQWSVSIGKIEDGKLVAGSICAPEFGLSVTGEKNVGVVVKDQYPQERFTDIIAGQDLFQLPQFKKFMNDLAREQGTMKKIGSGALGFALVTAGKADVCIQPVQFPWDFAAGAALVEAAGGLVIYYHYRENRIVRMSAPDGDTFNPKIRMTAVIASLGNQAEKYFARLQESYNK